MSAVILLLLLVVGHLFMSLLFYLNHRFIYHGKLGKTKLVKKWRRIHTRHHLEFHRPDSQHWLKEGRMPWWGYLIFAIAHIPIALISIPFAFGMYSYILLYEYAHHVSHTASHRKLGQPHLSHHKDPRVNHATVYVFWDKLFGTWKQP